LIFFRPLDLSVQHLNYETPRTIELRKWFFTLKGTGSPVVALEDESHPMQSSVKRLTWAKSQNIAYEGIAEFLPDPDEQSTHVESWRELMCGDSPPHFTEQEQKLFSSFLASISCTRLQIRDPLESPPSYLEDFRHQRRFIGLFLPQTVAEREQLKQKFPEASTPREMFESFPHILYGELMWMLPLSFVAALLFLWNHYRHIGWSVLATIPFLTGVGLFALVAQIADLNLSFISVIALVMVFGCSLDYGVFVLDFLLYRKNDRPGVWSALSLCASATIAGFAPLVFARHPVLNDLGQPLFWGTLGTLIGSLWGIPAVYGIWNRLRERPSA
jgi:hypothetical protein